jgi:hypothetical protein
MNMDMYTDIDMDIVDIDKDTDKDNENYRVGEFWHNYVHIDIVNASFHKIAKALDSAELGVALSRKYSTVVGSDMKTPALCGTQCVLKNYSSHLC